MKKHLILFLKIIALIASWIIFSPLILILERRWQMPSMWLRITTFIISPTMLLVYIIVIVGSFLRYQNKAIGAHFVRPQVVQNITGIEMPKYRIIAKKPGTRTFTMDYEDTFILKFRKMPDSNFYQQLLENDFDKEGDRYIFYLNWGSGLVPNERIPEGESGNYCYTMTITENKKIFRINVEAL